MTGRVMSDWFRWHFMMHHSISGPHLRMTAELNYLQHSVLQVGQGNSCKSSLPLGTNLLKVSNTMNKMCMIKPLHIRMPCPTLPRLEMVCQAISSLLDGEGGVLNKSLVQSYAVMTTKSYDQSRSVKVEQDPLWRAILPSRRLQLGIIVLPSNVL